jgi:hypothetical protein
MDKIREDMLFIAADGDGIGKKVGRAVIANDTEQLHKISERIDAAQDYILHWAKHHDGIKISGGGDEFTAAVPPEAIEHLESLRKDIEHAFGYTISIGVGKNLSEAGTALLVAKLRGKDQVVHFTDDVKKDIQKAKRRVREHRATPDENKLSEAYLEKAEDMNDPNCPYCQQTDGIDPNHCKMCHDMEAQDGQEACPFCAEAQNVTPSNDCPFCQENPGGESDCPFCATAGQSDQGVVQQDLATQTAPADDSNVQPDANAQEQNSKIQSPDSNNSQAPAGSAQERADYDQMGMNPPIAGKPTPGDNSSPVGEGQANPMDNTAGAPVAPATAGGDEDQGGDAIMPENAHSKEAMQAIAEQIQNETADGKTDEKQQAQAIDDTAIVGTGTEGNVSRPEGYGQNTPTDMGLDEEQAQDGNPDLSSVFKEGLDSQASNIDKEKVRDMVGQALAGFKASKQILEKAREQAPDFYQASIAMLAAMIKMAEMLGLSGGGASAEEVVCGQDSGQPAAGSESDWNEPFPKHPDHGGEKKPGHAPSKEEGAGAPKDRAPVGQPIGKLPSKATTHVARTPMPPGAINAKGQQKVIDPKTGKTRFIDRKQGMVQSSTGVPVKPPSRG